jgi:hypothetical protein
LEIKKIDKIKQAKAGKRKRILDWVTWIFGQDGSRRKIIRVKIDNTISLTDKLLNLIFFINPRYNKYRGPTLQIRNSEIKA